MTPDSLDLKPIFVSFYELAAVFADLHLQNQAMLDRLHDVWKQGAPSPESVIRNPRGYDERKRQPGNVEKRLLLPVPLANWICEASAARGMPLTARQAANHGVGRGRLWRVDVNQAFQRLFAARRLDAEALITLTQRRAWFEDDPVRTSLAERKRRPASLKTSERRQACGRQTAGHPRLGQD